MMHGRGKLVSLPRPMRNAGGRTVRLSRMSSGLRASRIRATCYCVLRGSNKLVDSMACAVILPNTFGWLGPYSARKGET
jgi:hypothetical protein